MGVKVIYADVLFLINFTVDFMCLYITRALVSSPARVWRISLAAALGGAYAVTWVALPYIPPLALLPVHALCAFVMILVSFGKKPFKRLCALCGVFALTAAVAGGVLGAAFSLSGGGYVVSGGVYADISPVFLLAVAAFSVGACYIYGVICRRRLTAKTAKAIIYAGEKQHRASLCVDTGCHVLDPFTGELVVIVSARVFGKDVPPATRFIPFSTAAGNTVLGGFRPQKLVIDGAEVSAIIAVSGEDEYYRGCDGLTPPMLVRGAKKEESGIC